MKRAIGIIGLLVLAAGICGGQERRDVLVQLMRVKVSDPAVVREVLGRTAANDEALYGRVEALLESGGATVEGLSSVRVPSGQRAKGNAQFLSVEPTEFEIDHETRVIAPLAAETWVYGPELEIDPTVSGDGKTVSLNFVISHGAGEPVEMPSRVGQLKKRGGTPPTMESRAMPWDRCSTGSHVASGERVLVSAMRRAPSITDGGGGDRAELLLTFLRATAADPEVPTEPSISLKSPVRIGVEVAVFEVDPAEAAALTWRRGEAGSDANLYAELVERVADGDVTLAALNYVSSRSGNRAKVERGSDHVYPTEYELSLMAPIAWETRNVGQTLEVDPVLGPLGAGGGGDEGPFAVSVNFAWEDVGFGKASEHRFDLGEVTSFVEHPTFESDRLLTYAVLEDGGARLVGVVQAPGEGVARLIFLKALQVAEPPRDAAVMKGGQVMMKTLVIGVPKAVAGQIGGVAGGGKAQAILDDLLAKVAGGGAEIVSQAGVHTGSGQRAKIESVDEVIYPREYEKGVEEGIWYPTGFETRNVGAMLTVEPVVQPGLKVIQTRFKLECDMAAFEVATLKEQAEVLVSGGAVLGPERQHLELDQQSDFATGEVALVHVGDAKGVEGRVDYVFVVGEVK